MQMIKINNNNDADDDYGADDDNYGADDENYGADDDDDGADDNGADEDDAEDCDLKLGIEMFYILELLRNFFSKTKTLCLTRLFN